MKTYLLNNWKILLPYVLMGAVILWGWHLIQQDAVDRAAVRKEAERYEQATKEYEQAKTAYHKNHQIQQAEISQLKSELRAVRSENNQLRKRNEDLYYNYLTISKLLGKRPNF